MKMLNAGCGTRFHKDWVNIDFISAIDNVISHNLLNGIPSGDAEFDVVYHSHVLEHFSKDDAKTFILECYRVLKHGGVIRIVVPDVEKIVKEYLIQLDAALKGNKEAELDYDWMMIELFDQMVRNYSGGKMAEYFSRDFIPNAKFVFGRIGEEGKSLHERYLRSKIHPKKEYVYVKDTSFAGIMNRVFSISSYKNKLKNILFAKELQELREQEKAANLGRFRQSGEIHQWMYDRYSLGKLLSDTGFTGITVKTAFESDIENWNEYHLESKDGVVYKPDSLFMEAIKK